MSESRKHRLLFTPKTDALRPHLLSSVMLEGPQIFHHYLDDSLIEQCLWSVLGLGGRGEAERGDGVRRGLVGHGRNSELVLHYKGSHQRSWESDLSLLSLTQF